MTMEEMDWGNRPLGISALAVLAFIGGALGLFVGGLVVAGVSVPEVYGKGAATGVVAMAVGTLVIILGVLVLVSGWGLWRGKSWAWTLNVVLCGVGMVFFATDVVLGQWLDVFGVPIQLYIVWYMWRPHVKAFFNETSKTPAPP